MDSSIDEIAGIWAHMVKFSPPQEVSEIKKIIGSHVIEENQVNVANSFTTTSF